MVTKTSAGTRQYTHDAQGSQGGLAASLPMGDGTRRAGLRHAKARLRVMGISDYFPRMFTFPSPRTTRPTIHDVSPARASARITPAVADGAATRTIPIPMLKTRYISSRGTSPSFWRNGKRGGTVQV